VKIAWIGYFQTHHTEAEIAEYMEIEGHQVNRFQSKYLDEKKFLAKANEYDLIITTICEEHSEKFWKTLAGLRKPKLVIWHFDWIFDLDGRDALMLPKARHFDLVLTTDGETTERYAEHGVRRLPLRQAIDPKVYKPAEFDEKYMCEVAFVGHIYTDRRRKLFKELRRRFDFKHFGQDDRVWGLEHAKICSSADILLADNYRNDLPGYWSSRVYLELGCGAFLLHPRVPLMEKDFTDRKHLAYWDDEDDLVEKIRYYLDEPEERRRIARAGCELVHRRDIWTERLKEFWELLSNSGLFPTQTNARG
jgi:spore maturation protein CgeB